MSDIHPALQRYYDSKASPEAMVDKVIMTLAEDTVTLLAKKMHPDAILPSRGSEGSAGYDLYSIGDWIIKSKGIGKIGTGIAVAIPRGYVGLIRDRSGLASRGITTQVTRVGLDSLGAWLKIPGNEYVGYSDHPLGGVIDSDYRGEIGVLLFNSGDKDMIIRKSDRVCQLLLVPVGEGGVIECAVFPVREVGVLDSTVRGDGGFGSTGK